MEGGDDGVKGCVTSKNFNKTEMGRGLSRDLRPFDIDTLGTVGGLHITIPLM